MDAIIIIGTICSIVGVPIALFQSFKAKSRAEAAQDAVQLMLEKNQLGVYSSILESGHRVENVLNTQRGLSKPKFGNKLKTATREIDTFIALLNEKLNSYSDSEQHDTIEKSLSKINEVRRDFNDENEQLNKLIEIILQHVQMVISITSDEKQKKEYK